jgi:gas vesicle protein
MINRDIANDIARQIRELRRDLEKNYNLSGIRREIRKEKDPLVKFKLEEIVLKQIVTDVKKSAKFANMSINTVNNLVKSYLDKSNKIQERFYEGMRKNVEGALGFLRGELSQVLGEAEGVLKFVKDMTMIVLKPITKLFAPIGRWIRDGMIGLGKQVKEKITDMFSSSKGPPPAQKIQKTFIDFVNFMRKMFFGLEHTLTKKYQRKIEQRLYGKKYKEGDIEDDDGSSGLSMGVIAGLTQALVAKLLKGGLLKKGLKFGAKAFGPLAIAWDAASGASDGGIMSAITGAIAGDKKGGMWNALENAGKWASAGALIGSIIPGIGTTVGGIAGGIVGFVTGALGADKIEAMISTTATTLENAFNRITTFGSDLFKKVGEWWNGAIETTTNEWGVFKTYLGNFYTEQKNNIDGLTNNIKSIFTEINKLHEQKSLDIEKVATTFYDKLISSLNIITKIVPGGPMMMNAATLGGVALSNVIFGSPSAGLNTGSNLIASPGGSVKPIPQQWVDLIKKSASESGFAPALIAGLINQESGWNPNAVSRTGARGLGQFMPGTARNLGINPDNPEEAIMGVGKYLKSLKETLIKGGIANPTIEQILAAYNAGPGSVIQSGGQIPNISETQKYVPAVLRATAQYGGTGSGGLFGMAQNLYNDASAAFQSNLQKAINAGIRYAHGGKNFESGGLDCSGFADWLMGSSLSAVNEELAQKYKTSVAGSAAGKAERIAQTFGVPLIDGENLNYNTLSAWGTGTVLSRTSPGSKNGKSWTGHNAVVTMDENNNLVVAETTGGNAPMRVTPLDKWLEINKGGGYVAANPLLSASSSPSTVSDIENTRLQAIEDNSKKQQIINKLLGDIKNQQSSIPKTMANVAQIVNKSNNISSGGGIRQVLVPPENIAEGQYILYALNSTYNG